MIIVHGLDLLAQLLQSELRLGFAVRMVEDIHQLSDDASEAVHKTCILAFQVRRGSSTAQEGSWLLLFYSHFLKN
jgi:hypothetical protein